MGSKRTKAAAASTTAASAADAGKKGRTAPAPTSENRAEAGHQGGSSSSTPASAAPGIDGFQVHALMNARYHGAREAYLDSVHRWLMFGIIILGAGAIGELVKVFDGLGWLTGLFGAGAAVLGALDLTFDLSNRARAHTLMRRRYFELLADVREGKRGLDEAEALLHRYSADEEPAYHILLAASWNAAQEMVYGDDADQYDIPRWHRRLKNLWRREGNSYSLKEKRATKSGGEAQRTSSVPL